MTERAYIEAMRDEVDIADLMDLDYREPHRNGFSINTDDMDKALKEVRSAGGDYRVQVWATTVDGIRYPAYYNEGRENGSIGSDGLIDLMNDHKFTTLQQAIEYGTHGVVPKDDVTYIQLIFDREHHRE
jgi:hypothetical protein